MKCYDYPEYLALVRAIAASPEDDLPRLVAADWLDEHGEHERATYIRCEVAVPADRPRVCQKSGTALSSFGVIGPLFVSRCLCKTCKTIRTGYNASKRHIRAEWEYTLQIPFTDRWKEENPFDIPFVYLHWNRGFVRSVTGTVRHLRNILPRLVAAEPIVQTPTGPLAVTVRHRNAPHQQSAISTLRELRQMEARQQSPTTYDWVAGTRPMFHGVRFHDEDQELRFRISAGLLREAMDAAGIPQNFPVAPTHSA